MAIPTYARIMPIVVVVPVKSFRLGNRRLANFLDDNQRASLGRGLATHVAEIAEDAGTLPVFVTADPDVATWATGLGFPSLPDPGSGLDDAATAGVEWAGNSMSRWIVLHSDLPLLDENDLRALTTQDGDVIAPSADGGTSAISATHPIRFAYGPGSFHRHLARLDSPTIVARRGLLHDVDSPGDLESALRHPKGKWLGNTVR